MKAFIGALKKGRLRFAQQFLANLAKLRRQGFFGLSQRSDLLFKAAFTLLQARFQTRQTVLCTVPLDHDLIKHRPQLHGGLLPCPAFTPACKPAEDKPDQQSKHNNDDDD